jgi:signal transduction histidine kinase
MLQLVLNILDVQKFEEAKMVLDKHEANLANVLGEACRQVEFMAVQKNIELQIQASPTLHATIDMEIITRIWVNLLTNALKYSPQNSTITLCISLEAGKAYCSYADCQVLPRQVFGRCESHSVGIFSGYNRGRPISCGVVAELAGAVEPPATYGSVL